MNQIIIQIEEQQPLNVGPFDFSKKLSFQNQSLFKFPGRIKCDGKYKPENLLVSDKPEQLIQTTGQILKNFQEKMLVWDIKDDFQFNVPPSYFNDKIEFKDDQNQIKKQIDQRELSWQNIAQIFQTGTFSVPSANFPLPFVWKISGWIIKGRENIIKQYYDDLSQAYYFFRQSYERLYHKSDYEVCGGDTTIIAGILNIVIKSLLYLSLIIGFRETYTITNDVAALQLEERRQRKLKEEGKFSSSLYKYLTTSQENVDKIQNYCQQFQKIADGIKFQVDNLVKLTNEKKYFSQEDEPVELNDQARQEINLPQDYLSQYNLQFDPNQNTDKQINYFQYEAQKKYWQRIKAIPYDVIQNIIDISECKRIYEYHYSIFEQSIDNFENQFKTELQRNHPIRSRIKDYVEEEMENYMNPIKFQLQTEMETNILNDLNELQLIDRFVYQNYLEFKKNFEQKCQTICQEYRKYFTIGITKECTPPFDVVKQNNVYKFEERKFYKIPTKYPFWKFYIFIFVFYTSTSDIIQFFYLHAIYGQLGLKVLFGRGVFYSDVKVDLQTGVVGPSGKEIKTILQHLKEVYEGMKTSRNNFEQQLDNGSSIKSILRIVNFMEVYFYRFTFIGIFCLSICFPLFILINVSISLILGLASLVYVPITLIMAYIFTIVLFDMHYLNDNKEKQEYQTIWHYDTCLPIITNTLRLVFQGVLQLVFAILFGFVIYPLLSILFILFAHIRYFLSTLHEFFMICIISCLGRMPTDDSCLAWRISGPGINKQYYNQLSIENVLLLIAVDIEKIILLNYQKWTESSIDDPSKKINQEINLQFPHVTFYDPGCAKLKQNLLSLIEVQKKNYPQFDINLKVRYTEYELKCLIAQAKQFLKSQIVMKNQQRYLWYYYRLQEGDYNALAKKLVTNALGQQVFEPILESELKFILYQSKDQELLIQKALEGQVDFKMPDKKNDVVVNQPINFKRFISFQNVITEIKNCQQQTQTWCSAKTNQGFYINYVLQ